MFVGVDDRQSGLKVHVGFLFVLFLVGENCRAPLPAQPGGQQAGASRADGRLLEKISPIQGVGHDGNSRMRAGKLPAYRRNSIISKHQYFLAGRTIVEKL